MLNDSYTLGLSGNLLTFTKRFADLNASQFSVAGLTPNSERALKISHEQSSNGQVRTIVSLDENDEIGVPPSTKVEKTRVYLVIQRAPSKSAAGVKATISRLKTLVDDTAFQDKLLNLEV
jgi:hypothetical protein